MEQCLCEIFNYHKWDSVKDLIFMLSRMDLHHIINSESLKLVLNMFERLYDSDRYCSENWMFGWDPTKCQESMLLCSDCIDVELIGLSIKLNLWFTSHSHRINLIYLTVDMFIPFWYIYFLVIIVIVFQKLFIVYIDFLFLLHWYTL